MFRVSGDAKSTLSSGVVFFLLAGRVPRRHRASHGQRHGSAQVSVSVLTLPLLIKSLGFSGVSFMILSNSHHFPKALHLNSTVD